MARSPFPQRFWTRISKTENHWLWTGALDKDGYGTMSVHGDDPTSMAREDGKTTPRRAHRLSYELLVGPIGEKDLVLHKNECNTRACVRPDHLYLGDPQRNMDDREEIGHTSWGENRPASKLTEGDVAFIRKHYRKGIRARSLHTLAFIFNVHFTCIHWVVSGRNWSRVA